MHFFNSFNILDLFFYSFYMIFSYLYTTLGFSYSLALLQLLASYILLPPSFFIL